MSPHPWALLIIKHEARFIMNQTYGDHGIRVGGILCLLLNTRREIYGYKVPSKYSTDFL